MDNQVYNSVLNERRDSPLNALVMLIASSVADIDAEFEAAGLPAPSLDASSFGDHDSHSIVSSTKVNTAVRIVEAACAQLCASVARPEHVLLNKGMAYEMSASLQVVASANIAGLLLDRPGGVHTTELSASSGINADKLGRILRFLAINHIFQEVNPNVYANNKLSAKLALSESTKEAVELVTREPFKAAAYLSDYLKITDVSAPISPFQIVFGVPLMDYHSTARVMGWGEVTGKADIIRVFPWTKYISVNTPFTICDIGAGKGDIMLMLARAYESYLFRAVIQDRPAFIELSKQLWSSEYPEAIQEGRIDFVPIDFFKDTPVEGCDIYYVRLYFEHNWPDNECVVILKNVAKAMYSRAESILLIQDIVLRHAITHNMNATNSVDTDVNLAPAPLLPNFGAARYREYAADINMLNLLGAKERTLEEFIALGSQAGFAFHHVWDAGETSLVEFRLIRASNYYNQDRSH
ncbi:S-adenosyl-L-methionine-dependent methyltransferase [Phellopilus nigrolimitatus]|nr:S-adenosyl-L-methionine-dependent methyltransferase [Phellopilus nigrolimitatus]